MKDALQKATLYGICDLGYLSLDRAIPVSRQLLVGGAGILQLRAKGHDPASLLDLARGLRVLCEEFAVPFIVNDHLQLAKESQAHGLHLGQDDGDLEEARQFLEPGTLIGRSTHSLDQAKAAWHEGADYIGFGPLFPTPTKKGRPGIGLENISMMQREVGAKIPAFCIGGIKPDNLPQVREAGASRVVVVSHLLQSPEPAAETERLISRLGLST